MTRGRAGLELGDRPDAVPVGRRFVEDHVLAVGATAALDEVTLVASELLANAVQHGDPPIWVSIETEEHWLRLEVGDGSNRLPVPVTGTTENMTGRGLRLVGSVVARWGVDRRPGGGGKVIWAEFDLAGGDPPSDAPSVEDLLAQWAEEGEPGDGEERHLVVLGDVPTDLLLQAKGHIDNLVREFSLAAAGQQQSDEEVPEHLARLIETVVHGFSDARDAIKRQALAAARRGQARTSLRLNLPLSAATAGEAYLAALDQADTYARAARLLTLETPPDHRLFRQWYVQSVVTQLREVADGRTPSPVTPFEDVLVTEIRRLASAQRDSQRMTRLQRVTAALAQARTPEDVAAVVVSEGVDALGASGGGMLLPSADGVHVAVPGVVGYAAELVGALRDERLDAPLPAATALRTGKAVWLESVAERDREFPALEGFESSTVAMCAVPLEVGGRRLGALRFSFNGQKLFDEDERTFVLALAAQTALTLQRTELYEAERDASLNLQRALLPSAIPTVPGWDVATHYSPAGEQEAGGDFYDVLAVEGGRIVAMVGDVMGRGIDAAAAMAQIRSTIRAYAVSDPDPVSVFEHVDEFFNQLDLSQLVTVLYILLDPRTSTAEIANAGHLPPLLVDATGARAVVTPTGTPFGAGGDVRQTAVVTLSEGAALAIVTDGLVERRGEDIEIGYNRLAQATRNPAGANAQSVLDQLLAAATRRGLLDDDVTALVLRRNDATGLAPR